ncbi:glutathione-dependent formaldehyde-activating enzyme [Apiospora saccharicola]|uniref:Glutathione-dependent formaldehyde-activating enzyme n=1 Tax=Apiospora saccharicola TaxID=335842 RepID=A0ABR1TKM3_9PEZI
MDCRCQCGAVQFTTPLEQPLALYICHCFECRLQTSSAFGTSAIFPKFQLPNIEGLSCYTYFCRSCGTRLVHTTPVSVPCSQPDHNNDNNDPYYIMKYMAPTSLLTNRKAKNVVSVKGGCITKGLDWNKAIHIYTKSAMVPIPEGCESHEEAAPPSEYSASQDSLDQPMDPGCLTGSGGTPGVFPGPTQVEELDKLRKVRGPCEMGGF